MQTHQVLVTKDGSLGFNRGDVRLSQGRMVAIINKELTKDQIIGHFSVKLPDDFDLWGGNAASRKAVTEMLEKGRVIAGIKKKGKK
jgi:hypothetical protein